ncbi:aminotransferase [Nitzschia inconspicua]|uniref:Aminotransferase n=1 Tax=Nitzschia inconspicua TaxID=303405 RepID=A0A9K3LM83_9STRA|nr:aminotransferase [Nitzschia inconspicua]
MVENPRSFEEDRIESTSCGGRNPMFDPNINTSGRDVIYLNNAGQAWLDPDVQAVGRESVNNPPFVQPSAEISGKIRQSFAQLIQAQPKEIAIVPSTAFAITMAAKNILRLCEKGKGHERNKILLLQDQMCSAVYPWQGICDESEQSDYPLSLDIVPYPKDGSGWTDAVLSHLSAHANEILVACLPPLHWSDGAIVDLSQIDPVCRAKRILLVIDATQAVGIMPLNVQQLQPAMLACSIHKWLRGPSGASLVYIDKSLFETWSPLDQHGRSRDMKVGPSWESYPNEMTTKGYPDKFVPDARKFDGGGKPNPIILPMLQKSLEQVLERVNLHTCQSQLRTIVNPLLTWITANPDKFEMPKSPHVYHLIGIRPTDGWLSVTQMLKIAKTLQTDHQIFLAVRCGAFRISPYMNTTEHDMNEFLRIFDGVVTKFWSGR